MTQSPNPSTEPNVPSRQRWRRFLIWGGVGFGVTSVAVGTAAVWFIRYELAPTIARVLEDIIQRPVDVGPVERFTLNSIRFGPSVIPRTPNSPSNASAEAVEVGFSILSFYKPAVSLDITLINPKVYLEENEQGDWLQTTLNLQEESIFRLEFRTIGVENADIRLMPYEIITANQAKGKLREPIGLNVDEVRVNLTEENQTIEGDVNGQFALGGKFNVKVNGFLPEGRINAQVRANGLNLPQLDWVVPTPGFVLQQGMANANLSIKLEDYKPLDLRGTLNLSGIQVGVQNVQQPLNLSEAKLRFAGTQIIFDEFKSSWQDLAVNLKGNVITNSDLDYDQTRFNLIANLQPVQFSTLLEAVEEIQQQPFTLPFPLAGEVAAEFKLGGTVLKPQILGAIATTEPTLIDKIDFSTIQTKFSISGELNQDFSLVSDPILAIDDLLIEPAAGGSIQGKGTINLEGLMAVVNEEEVEVQVEGNRERGKKEQVLKEEEKIDTGTVILPSKTSPKEFKPSIDLEITANNIPGDAIAQSYGLLPQFRLGTLSANVNVAGTLENLNGKAQFSLPDATYPIAGIANFKGEQADATVQVADGTLNLMAQLPTNDVWNAAVKADNLALTPLVNLGILFADIPNNIKAQIQSVNLEDSRLNLQANIRGYLENFDLSTLTADSDVQLDLIDGRVNAIAQLNQGQWKTDFDVNSLTLPRLVDLGLSFANLAPELANPIQNLNLQNGTLSAQGSLSGNLENSNPSNITGNAATQVNLGNLGGTVAARGNFINGEFTANFNTNSVPLSPLKQLGLEIAELPANVRTTLQNIDLRNGTLQATGILSGNIDNLAANTLSANLNSSINLGNFGGRVQATGSLSQGQFQGNVTTQQIALQPLIDLGLPLANLDSDINNQIQQLSLQNGTLQANAIFTGNINNLDPNALTANLNSLINLGDGGGSIKISGEATAGRWQANLIGDQIALSRFSQFVESQNPQLIANLKQQGLVEQADNMPLLRGLLDTEINALGSLSDFNPNNLQARANLRLTELPIIKQPFEAVVGLNRGQVQVEKAETPQFGADGFFAIQLQGTGVPQISNLDLNVRVTNFDLNSPLVQNVLATLPDTVTEGDVPLVRGLVTFQGKVRGSLTSPTLTGNLSLNNLAIRDVQFDPLLTGPVAIIPGQRVDVALAGQQDKIELVLDDQYLPVSFLVQRADAKLAGTPKGKNLLVTLENFPLQTLSVAPLAQLEIGELRGEASGVVEISNLRTFDINQIGAVGQLTVIEPALGHLNGDRFGINLNFQNGVATVTDGVLRRGETEVLIAGQANISGILASLSNPNQPVTEDQFQGTITIPQGTLQDVLVALQWFEFDDLSRGLKAPNYANARAVQPVPVGLPSGATLLDQLRRLEEIQALLEQSLLAQAESPLPPLKDLQGDFQGEITFNGSIQAGVTANATINGDNWTWGEYRADDFLLEANFQENDLRVEPIQLRSGPSLFDFRGSLDLAQQTPSGQFRIKNVRLEDIERFFDIPNVDLTGQLNLRATVTGSLNNPQASGELTILEGTLNTEPIQEANASFGYNNSRLRFGGSLLVTEQDPIAFKGSIPYRLPFATVVPESNQLEVAVNVQDQGLAVINLLNPEIDWVQGKGLAQLKIGGTLDQTAAGEVKLSIRPEGLLKLQDVALEARSVNQSIVGLSGTALFTGDRIIVKDIQGKLEGETGTGQLLLQGVLPVAAPLAEQDPDRQTPLELALQNLKVNVEELYTGDAAGLIQVRGTVLRPAVGGEVVLSNGQVILPTGETTDAGTPTALPDTGPIEIRLNDFKVTLAEDVQVRTPKLLNIDAPVVNFTAQGSIAVNGGLDSLDSIRPQGVIELTGGAVNLYTSQLRLDQGYPQTATFLPSEGLDPILDLRLVTRVPEALRFVSPPSAFPSELSEVVSPNRVGTVRTIRVLALVRGPASKIDEIIQLQSSPPRSETELIALLGGSVIQGIQEDSTLVLANIASTGLFSDLQRKVIAATGLSEFRLYPARIIEERSRGSASALGLGLEVGLDVTKDVSVSVNRVLAANQPFLFSINYRLNDNLLLRGATNFRNESEIRFEYETRF